MSDAGGAKQLRHLLQPVKWAGFDVRNRVKSGIVAQTPQPS